MSTDGSSGAPAAPGERTAAVRLDAESFYDALGFGTVEPVELALGPDLRLPGLLMQCAL